MSIPASTYSLTGAKVGRRSRSANSAMRLACVSVKLSQQATSASGRSLVTAANDRSSAEASRASCNVTCRPSADAAPLTSLVHAKFPGLAGFQSKAIRPTFGVICLKTPSRFCHSASLCVANPVILASGRPRLATIPPFTGSVASSVATTGIAFDARFAASAADSPEVTMTSTFSRTSWFASSGSRSRLPFAYR